MFIVFMFTSSAMFFLLFTTSSSLIALQISDKIIKCRHVSLKLLFFFKWMKNWVKKIYISQKLSESAKMEICWTCRSLRCISAKEGFNSCNQNSWRVFFNMFKVLHEKLHKNSNTGHSHILKIHDEHKMGRSCTKEYLFFIQCYL